MDALPNGGIGFDLEWPGEVKIEVTPISEGCNLETLADKDIVTIILQFFFFYICFKRYLE